MKALKEEKRRNEREKVGLSPEFIDIKDRSRDPGLRYVTEPSIRTKNELNNQRRQENYEEFKKTEER